ncbi:MAG: GNAT family N-acetyltransferase [Actinomycetes bacterium]
MTEPAIRRLLAGDDTSSFRCGDPEYDLFLQRYAGQNQDRLFVGTTYAAVEGPRVVGYVTVAVGHLDRDDVPSQAQGGLPRYPLPVLRLARLAIDEAFQGRGLGHRLAAYAFAVALQVRGAAGCVGVVVDALPDRVGFYADLGFVELELISGQSPIRPQPVVVFLPIAAVEAALSI